MVSTAEARQQITRARQQLTQRKKEISTAREQVSQKKKALGQASVIRQLDREGQLARQKALVQLRTREGTISQAEQELTGQVAGVQSVEQKLADFESQVKQIEQAKADFIVAQRATGTGGFPERAEAIFALETAQQQKFFRLIRQGQDASIRESIKDLEEDLETSLSEKEKARIFLRLRGAKVGEVVQIGDILAPEVTLEPSLVITPKPKPKPSFLRQALAGLGAGFAVIKGGLFPVVKPGLKLIAKGEEFISKGKIEGPKRDITQKLQEIVIPRERDRRLIAEQAEKDFERVIEDLGKFNVTISNGQLVQGKELIQIDVDKVNRIIGNFQKRQETREIKLEKLGEEAKVEFFETPTLAAARGVGEFIVTAPKAILEFIEKPATSALELEKTIPLIPLAIAQEPGRIVPLALQVSVPFIKLKPKFPKVIESKRVVVPASTTIGKIKRLATGNFELELRTVGGGAVLEKTIVRRPIGAGFLKGLETRKEITATIPRTVRGGVSKIIIDPKGNILTGLMFERKVGAAQGGVGRRGPVNVIEILRGSEVKKLVDAGVILPEGLEAFGSVIRTQRLLRVSPTTRRIQVIAPEPVRTAIGAGVKRQVGTTTEFVGVSVSTIKKKFPKQVASLDRGLVFEEITQDSGGVTQVFGTRGKSKLVLEKIEQQVGTLGAEVSQRSKTAVLKEAKKIEKQAAPIISKEKITTALLTGIGTATLTKEEVKQVLTPSQIQQLESRQALEQIQKPAAILGLAQPTLQPREAALDTATTREILGLAQPQLLGQQQLLGLGQGLGTRAPPVFGIPIPTEPPPGLTPITFTTPIDIPGTQAVLSNAIRKLRAKKAAFDVFVKKRGKFRKVADDLPIGRALKKGATITKQTIASTFKVIRDKKAKITKTDIDFQPDPNIFRNFKITKGKRVPLPQGPDVFQFIEKQRKRLTTFGETREIVGIRKRKQRGGFL